MSLQCTKTILKTTCSIHKQAHSTPNRLGLQPPRLGLQPLRVGLQPHWQGQPHMAGFIASAGQPPVGGCIAPLGQIYSLPAPESALMYTQCTRNMLGTTFVSHTQHRQNREKQENHVCFTVTQGNRNCQPLQSRPRDLRGAGGPRIYSFFLGDQKKNLNAPGGGHKIIFNYIFGYIRSF